jgi:hypothetical protein
MTDSGNLTPLLGKITAAIANSTRRNEFMMMAVLVCPVVKVYGAVGARNYSLLQFALTYILSDFV